MKTNQKEMTAVSVGAETRSYVPKINFNVISLPDPQTKSKDYFYTVDAETLLTTTLPPIRFVVGELLPQGLHILAVSSKIGKSWLVLWWCLQIARGESVWTFPTEKGTVLYLCLEDSFSRIQDRLFDFTSEAPSNLHFATMAKDIPFRQLRIAFDTETHIWNLVSDSVTEEPKPSDNIIFLLCEFLKSVQNFCGTATELADAIGQHSGEKIRPNVLAKKLVRFADELSSYGICCDRNRTRVRKEISLSIVDDGCDGNDGKTGSGSVSDLSTQPSQSTRDIESPDKTAVRLGTGLSLERQASHPAIHPAMPCDRRMQLARGAAPGPGENGKTGEENER